MGTAWAAARERGLGLDFCLLGFRDFRHRKSEEGYKEKSWAIYSENQVSKVIP